MEKYFDKVVPFKGIPNAMDCYPYAKQFYKAIETSTLQHFGPNASILEAKKVMNYYGNLDFFQWFPDLFNTEKELLKDRWQISFTLIESNPFADYLHGISHIRSLSEHTAMGEACLIPDNFYTLGRMYRYYRYLNKTTRLDRFTQSPFEALKVEEHKKGYKNVWFWVVRKICDHRLNREVKIYEGIYKKSEFKKDFPLEPLSKRFLRKPINAFEKRLSLNMIRAIYMDEKFKYFSSQQKTFIHTPVNISISESYKLIFSTDEEDNWIMKIHNSFIQSQLNDLTSIVNSYHAKSGIPHAIAKNTIRELFQLVRKRSK